ncbi:MAG: radical SAM/SPASM domain-containing protein [Clostridiales bacterium]|nr:radical SAM/SPASM domain-containing protein [Clostridiales bacterium]
MIHQYKNHGYNIVLDVNSGSVHVVDDLTYEVIALLEDGRKELGLATFQELAEARAAAPDKSGFDEAFAAAPGQNDTDIDCAPMQIFPSDLTDRIVSELSVRYPAEEICEALGECAELTASGVLFTEDIYENAIIDYKARKTVVKALCLHIAHDCNLACRYCFAEEGEYHGRRALMSFEVGKKALDFLIANSGSRRNLEVDFFGGEPLMNWQVVKDLVRYGREQEKIHNKNFRFTMTTNGVLLNDEIMEFLNQEMANVVLSIDGRPEVHDYMRPFRGGKGSYDLIMPKFRRFVELRSGKEASGADGSNLQEMTATEGCSDAEMPGMAGAEARSDGQKQGAPASKTCSDPLGTSGAKVCTDPQEISCAEDCADSQGTSSVQAGQRLQSAPDGSKTWYVRGTFTHHNLDFCNDVLHLLDAGFDRISIEPVVAEASEDYAIREEDLPQIFSEYDRLTDEMIRREKEGRGFTFFHFMLDLSGGPCVYKRLSGCGSGTEYLAVTPWGDLYPCHQFVGHEEYLMGNVDEGITRPEIVDEFKGCNVYTKEKCKNCFAKFYCSGGCAANSYNFHGTILDAYDIGCELMRKRVECAIAIKAALAEG